MAGHAASGLDIRVLGPLEVHADGAPLVVDTRKALAILALLAVEGRPFARDELAAMFWPEADDEAARGSLRRTLSTLRSGLADRWLVVDRARVALEMGGVSLDLTKLGRHAGDAVADLELDAAQVRGPFLAGFNLRDSPAFDDWRATRASDVERQVMDVLDRLARGYEAAGDLEAAAATVRRRLELDPLDEPAQRRLIGLLADAGDRSGAIRQYRTCVAVLERELGVAPLLETTALYDAIRDGERAAPSARPDSGLRPPAPVRPPSNPAALPLVGREEEMAAALDAYARADPNGRVLAVEGEPGIGKSRLADEVAREVAARGGEVLLARVWPSEGGIAYAPVAAALQAALRHQTALRRLESLPDAVLADVGRLVVLPPDLQRRTPPAGEDRRDPALARSRLVDALATALSALVAGPRPGLLVVDDVQWADASTVELLAYLVRRLEGRSMLVLLAWRAEELDAPAISLAGIVERLEGRVLLRLGRLDEGQVRELLAAVDGGTGRWSGADAAALMTDSEGLPLYLSERLLAGPADPTIDDTVIPRTFRALLRDRLARVGETAGQVLAAAAVIGRSFDFATLRFASGRSEDETLAAVEELLRRGLIRDVETGGELRFEFSHASLRDAAYDATSLVRRRVLHGRVADALRSGGVTRSPGADLARLVLIAQHERDAGRAPEAAEAFEIAARRARALFANREAIELLDEALALGHPAVAALQRLLGELRLGLGEYTDAIAAFEAAAALSAGLELAELELLLGRAHARRGDLVAAASHLDAALSGIPTAAETDGRRVRVRALVERSVVALRQDDHAEATTRAEEALALATTIDDSAGAGIARRIRGLIARSRNDLLTARDELRASLALAADDVDPAAAIAAGNALALVEAAAGDPGSAIEHLQAALVAARTIGERHLEAAIENNLADSYHLAGEEEESMAHLRRAVSLFAEIGGRPSQLEPEIWKLESW
jgi:DNA-binding SARP family transcriptional activator